MAFGDSAGLFVSRPVIHVVTFKLEARIGNITKRASMRYQQRFSYDNQRAKAVWSKKYDVIKFAKQAYHIDINFEMIVLNKDAIQHVQSFSNPIKEEYG